jgi:ParB-like chromosome segregation protein Spo0J
MGLSCVPCGEAGEVRGSLRGRIVTAEPRPIWQIMPEMPEAEFQRFVARLAAHGYLAGQEVKVDREGRIIDGHHRARACAALGIDYPREVIYPDREMSDDEKWEYVWLVNVSRRHLTLDQQRHLIREWLKRHPETSNRSVAADVGVSHVTVERIREELEETGQIDQYQARGGRGVTTGVLSDRPRNGSAHHDEDVEADEREVMTDVADHRQGVWFEVTIGFPAPSQVARQRGDLPYSRESERREWHSTRLYLTTPAPRSLMEASAVVKELAESLWRQVQADPLITMLSHA